MLWNDWDDDDDDDWDDDDDDDRPWGRGWYKQAGYASRKINRLFAVSRRIPMSEEEREDFQEQLKDIRDDLNDAEDDDDLEDILEELDDLEEDLEDSRDEAWDEAWEEEWKDIYDLPWDGSFWRRKGAHLPLRVSCSTEMKGKAGEQIVAKLLATLPKDQYHVMNDVLIEIGNISSQIDHIVVSQYGIFVIETKNYAGFIRGQEEDFRWTQVIGKKRCWFYNPLKQNERHMQVIERCIQRTLDEFIPVVVFSRNCNLQVNTKSPVLYSDTMIDYICSYDRPIYSRETMMEIEKRISESSNPSYQARMRHILRYKR